MNASDLRRYAQQIVKESFNDIICGNFKIPSEKEMENHLKRFIDYTFDEYQATRKILASHPGWNEEMVANELERSRMKYDKEFHTNLMLATNRTVEEIENLIKSLDDTIKEWKIKNID